jgi:hypothetical protein
MENYKLIFNDFNESLEKNNIRKANYLVNFLNYPYPGLPPKREGACLEARSQVPPYLGRDSGRFKIRFSHFCGYSYKIINEIFNK